MGVPGHSRSTQESGQLNRAPACPRSATTRPIPWDMVVPGSCIAWTMVQVSKCVRGRGCRVRSITHMV
eukprot:665724-Prymnesium_polylepis.1